MDGFSHDENTGTALGGLLDDDEDSSADEAGQVLAGLTSFVLYFVNPYLSVQTA
jgi:hypothetical protein